LRQLARIVGRLRRWTVGAVALAAGALALALSGGLPGPGATSRAAGQTGEAEPTPQTDDSVPATRVTMFGAAPQEAQFETWGIGRLAAGPALVRYVAGEGWSLGPQLLDHAGQPLAGFKPNELPSTAINPLSAQMTPDGSGVLVGGVPAEEPGAERQLLLVRNPGGAFQETAPAPSEGEHAVLHLGESLFGTHRTPLVAALEESGGAAGALVVPAGEPGQTQDAVLHWDGERWTREPIELPGATEREQQESGFQVLAIGASSPNNAWLLAEPSSQSEDVALYRRVEERWKPVTPSPLEVDGEPLTVPGAPEKIQAQVIDVTGEGVWVDGERPGARASTTIFFKPEGQASGSISASWCRSVSEHTACTYELPEELPTGPSSSFAWNSSSAADPFGERVITGFREGVTLRLDGTEFKRVLALGGSSSEAPGGAYGAAFSNAREGWLGEEQLPVHLTLQPTPSRLAPWPVSFRHTLLAMAPQPGAPVGALSSEALAVGDLGEVARYQPGEGWLPESLLSPSGVRQTPRLRAVAWPTPSRIYAVGDLGQMWLWRAETGLWEKDPATPPNFRGNLMGIAFDPSNPALGYAVGQGGVLLRYGKTWTQEALPAQVAGASFTSIAFAGSEAIVAYRELPNPLTDHYTGGLLVNNGSGWHVDEEAAAVMGSHVPWAVAGLPDGGAAFVGEGQVFERQEAGTPWQAATRVPAEGQVNAITLFREGSALRAILSGTPPGYFQAESVVPSAPGTPPPLIPPYPLRSESEKGLLRQTASGWSDEEHELNNAREPFGSYTDYDAVYQPDPVSTVLVNESGGEGWAVGGFAELPEHSGVLDTADIDRYPADGASPPGVGSSTVPLEPDEATFAIGGNAQCAAPCADRADADIGPDVWLSNALARAHQIGVRAFLYTGPRVTTGQTQGPKVIAVPYARELARYAQLLAGSPLPTFPAATRTDLDEEHNETTFDDVFAGFPQPFGEAGAPPPGITPAGDAGERAQCAATTGCEAAYYAFDSAGAKAGESVRVIVLDDSAGGDVDATQQEWLKGELEGAKAAREPAIVVGNESLQAQIAAGDGAAEAVAQMLAGTEANGRCACASAYFYDSPEKNVKGQLPAGGNSIPTFGSGTLGYVSYLGESRGDFLGASGFLLGQVNFAKYNQTTNIAEVTARLIPNIGELELEAKGGILLRRSQSAPFDGLARRPRAGNRSANELTEYETDPYIPIPSNCIGTACPEGILPEYLFTSSRPDFGQFVERNLESPEANAVLLNAKGEPIADEPRNSKGELNPEGRFAQNALHEPINEHGEVLKGAQSGVFCAYNAGTTIVTINAGGLSSSLPVTVQAGSVRRPCGTQPLKEQQAAEAQETPAPPPPPSTPAPAGVAPASSPPPVVPPPPPPPAIAALPAPPVVQAVPHKPPPFAVQAALAVPVLAAVPPPVPTPARPSPPTGTSAVTSPVEVAEREEEHEEAPESVSNQALAYRAPEHEPSPLFVLGAVMLAAFAAASGARRVRGRGRRELQVAPATLTTMRRQRHLEREIRDREQHVIKW
jgi:hypothetical protein